MPVVDGFEVLEWWRRRESKRDLTIFVMSSFRDEGHLQKAINLGAVGYRVKPSGFDYLVCVTRELGERWLGCAGGD
jgi:CheY-like chemotaxis protein